MKLFMNVSVGICQGSLFIIDIQTASELHMGSSSRQVYSFAAALYFALVFLVYI